MAEIDENLRQFGYTQAWIDAGDSGSTGRTTTIDSHHGGKRGQHPHVENDRPTMA